MNYMRLYEFFILFEFFILYEAHNLSENAGTHQLRINTFKLWYVWIREKIRQKNQHFHVRRVSNI